MKKIPMTINSRLKEMVCVVLGHDWTEYGRITDEEGQTLEEYSVCNRCKLENHDRQGYLDQYESLQQRSCSGGLECSDGHICE